MKKIMFNDKFGLTQAVLEGRKTQTRRIITGQAVACVLKRKNLLIASNLTKDEIDKALSKYGSVFSPYKVGDIVAIAQRYKDLISERDEAQDVLDLYKIGDRYLTKSEMRVGFSNKMFVRADLMPHHIKIERIRVERLQDISEEDCIKEGVCFHDNPSVDHKYDPYTPWPYYVKPYRHDIDNIRHFCKARFAYAYLIDKINGKGTWEANPWVFAYDFKLIK